MPSDGQQVYGAQHPPSIKLIKELKSSVPSSESGTLNSSNSHVSSFKDYEKKTFDVWDIDHDVSEYSQTDSHLISIQESEEMAKKIIKDHQENQAKLRLNSTLPNLISSKNNGPGKALRQGFTPQDKKISPFNSSKQEVDKKISTLANTFQASSISSQNEQYSISKQNVSSPNNPSSTNPKNSSNILLNHQITENSETQFHSNKYFVNTINQSQEQTKIEKFQKIIESNPVNLEDLQKACWKGIPCSYRPICWKLLSDYLPLKQELQEKAIEQKRNAYWESVNEHYSSIYIDSHHEMLRQILNDIPRMNPLIPIFQKKIVQDIFQRVLYVWAVRHPASGYVQGINDLLTPFFTVFLTEYTDSNFEIQNVDIENLPKNHLRCVEADSYWCMTKLLERIQENYVFSQPGIQRKVQSLEDLIKRIDNSLYTHLKKNQIEFIQFAFRWMNNLLMREIPLSCTIRLWDTYHAEPFGFSDFHLYVCAAFILRFSKNIVSEKDFQGLMLLLQNLPTKNLKSSDITLLTAEAYKLQVMFANSPNHIA